MIWKRGLESTGEVDLTQIFRDLRDRDIEAERNEDVIIYDGKELSFEITEDEVEYTQLTSISSQDGLEALNYLQRTLKRQYGFVQKSVETDEDDEEINIMYS